jgi:pyruvate kinase
MIRSLFDAGVDMFRLNFSHGTHEDHRKRFEAIRDVERDVDRPIGIMMDRLSYKQPPLPTRPDQNMSD